MGQSGESSAFLPHYHASNENIDPESEYGNHDFGHPIGVQQGTPFPDNGCQCGASCNCVYCTKHPTNPATRDRIGELYNIMDGHPPENHADASQPTSSYDNLSATLHSFEPQLGFVHRSFMQDDQELEFQNQGMDPQSFFEMAYPVGGCANGYCRCGDNCACDGCLTHTGHLQTQSQ